MKPNQQYQKARYNMDIIKSKDNLYLAKDHLEEAINIDPNFVKAQTQIGWINHKLGYYEKAEEQLNFALEIAKQDGTSLSNGYVYIHELIGYPGGYEKGILKKKLKNAVSHAGLVDCTIFQSSQLYRRPIGGHAAPAQRAVLMTCIGPSHARGAHAIAR